MRRKRLPGLSVGGAWTLPTRETISALELAYIIELPLDTVRALGVPSQGGHYNIRVVNELLLDLVGAEFVDWQEASLFAGVISGKRVIDENGNVLGAVDGRPFRRLERRTMTPANVVKPDLKRWQEYRAKRVARRRKERQEPGLRRSQSLR